METKIKGIIKEKFGANTLAIKRITEGYSHYMYDVTLDKKPFECIIRFSNNFKETLNLSKEKSVIGIMNSNGIPVPKIYAFNKHVKQAEEDYLILEKCRGVRLDTIWDKLSDQEKIKITKKIGELLSRIHNIKFDKFGFIMEGGKIKHEHLKPEFVSSFMRYLAENLETIDYSGSPCLVHNDFMPGHVFVEKNGEYNITGIIDFELAAAFSPEIDFIKLHRCGFFDNKDLQDALIEGYGPINDKAVKIHRIIRDMEFASMLLDAGNKELSDKTLRYIEEQIE